MDPNSWAKHNFKGKARVSTGFFYIVMAFEMITEIDLGSEWHFPMWCSKLPFPPTAASRPTYSSCSWNSSMTNILVGEKGPVRPCALATCSLLWNVSISLKFGLNRPPFQMFSGSKITAPRQTRTERTRSPCDSLHCDGHGLHRHLQASADPWGTDWRTSYQVAEVKQDRENPRLFLLEWF